MSIATAFPPHVRQTPQPQQPAGKYRRGRLRIQIQKRRPTIRECVAREIARRARRAARKVAA